MKMVSKFKKLFRFLDYFATPQLLRYSGKSAYSTATGGICSIFIAIVFAITFVNMSVQTIQKQLINYSFSSLVQSEPSLRVISTYPAGKFMFAACIQLVNLNHQRYFDVVAYKNNASDTNKQFSLVELQPCTLAHFSMNSDTVNRFQSLFYTCMCPPLSLNFQMQGSISSQLIKTFNIVVAKCNSTGISDTRACVDQAGFKDWEAQYASYTFRLNFVNPLISPSSKEYLTSYIEERLSMKFSRTLGAFAYIDFEDFTITTDQSILPYTDYQTDVGVRVNPVCQNHRYEMPSGTQLEQNTSYATFFCRKSLEKSQYIRSFNKIDSLVSYIGGLISIVFSAAYFFRKYTQMALELEIGGKLYRPNQLPGEQITYKNSQENLSDSFNIYTFCVYCFYKTCRLFGYSPEWKTMKDFEECRQEIVQQTNVVFLLERITFLERSIELMIEKFQFESLHLLERQTITKASIVRQKYDLKEQMTELRERQYERRYSLMGHAQDIIKFEQARNKASLSRCAQLEIKKKKSKLRASICTDLSLKEQTEIHEKANNEQIIQQQLSSSGSLSVHEQLDCKVFARIQQNMQKLSLSANNGNSLSKRILAKLAKITHEVFDSVGILQEPNDRTNSKEESKKPSQAGQIIEARPISESVANLVKHDDYIEPIA